MNLQKHVQLLQIDFMLHSFFHTYMLLDFFWINVGSMDAGADFPACFSHSTLLFSASWSLLLVVTNWDCGLVSSHHLINTLDRLLICCWAKMWRETILESLEKLQFFSLDSLLQSLLLFFHIYLISIHNCTVYQMCWNYVIKHEHQCQLHTLVEASNLLLITPGLVLWTRLF